MHLNVKEMPRSFCCAHEFDPVWAVEGLRRFDVCARGFALPTDVTVVHLAAPCDIHPTATECTRFKAPAPRRLGRAVGLLPREKFRSGFHSSGCPLAYLGIGPFLRSWRCCLRAGGEKIHFGRDTHRKRHYTQRDNSRIFSLG